MTTKADHPTVTVDHRGGILQVHLEKADPVGKRPGAEKGDAKEWMLHVQDLDGGRGRIVPLDSQLARELAERSAAVRAMRDRPDETHAAHERGDAGDGDHDAQD